MVICNRHKNFRFVLLLDVQPMNSQKISAVIFDMDGLLIDSEPFWQQAEKIVFKKVGIELTTEMCYETMGLRIDEVVMYWYEKKPWDHISLQEIQAEIIDRVIELIHENGKQKEGVSFV